ncbi:MAG TPA: polyribonucleotide nucleotidyltransferase [Candidatus Moranbacteria bacterium]|nr:polyribonucleotide nucleotidyltransferase [Candidatus Moranbacteria bacterium]
MEIKNYSIEVGGKLLQVEVGRLAAQAGGAVTITYGETVVLATATMKKQRSEGGNYFPLFVDYEERYYAAGKIKGSRFIKREGRPSDQAILNGRIVDRTIRPLFDERMRNEVQVIITVLSVDKENDPIICAVIAASLALGISDVPWSGPVAAIRIGEIENAFKINPMIEDVTTSPLNLLVSGTEEKINMIECEADQYSNEKTTEATRLAFEEIGKLARFQKEIIAEIGKNKIEVELTTPSEEFTAEVKAFLDEKDLAGAFYTKDKKTQTSLMEAIEESLKEKIAEQYGEDEEALMKRKAEASLIFENYLNDVLHERILKNDERPDGRKLDELRKISAEVGVLPRPHGTGLFQRGETQALTVATLGAPGDEQIIDTMETDEKKRYIHHYNFPPYSVGEVGFMRGPGRREIGHGALAEKALLPVLPEKEDFPYTILLVSEIMSSNGSSSMASTCGSTLALMDAGVPIKAPVSGIAMGIVTGENGEYKILTDIQGPEDHWGDMDFKVAGTKDGITAIQLDVKIDGITPDIVNEVLDRAYIARMEIMKTMLTTIDEPRQELSKYAPRIISMKIDPDKIRTVIGSGGKTINEIIDATGCEIDIEDDGSIFITAENGDGGERAKKWIEDLTHEVKAGEVYTGKVVKIMDFGAFVEILPGQDGMVHISQLSNERVAKVEDVVMIGQKVTVRVAEIDKMGRINLTMKGVKKE